MAACLRFTRRVEPLPVPILSETDRHEKVWGSFLTNKGHDVACFPQLKIEKAVPGVVHASLKIEDYNLNRVRTVHGGLIASLTDTLGSLAVATKGQYMTGVSTDIGTSFVKSAGTTGDVLNAKAVVVGLGRSLAYTRVEFMDKTGQLVAFGHHTKYVGKTNVHPKNVKFSEDGEKVIEGIDVMDNPGYLNQ